MRIPKLLLFALLLFASIFTMGQNTTPVAERDGVMLRKVVSDTVIPTGQTFSYNLYITIPAGLQAIEVFDGLPPGLVFHSISSIQPSLGTPLVITPTPTDHTVRLRWGPTTVPLNGMVTVVVSFPNGVTCNGDTAINQLDAAYRLNGVDRKLNTTKLKTRAVASNPWRVTKVTPGLANLGDACPTFLTDTLVVRYRIRVYKIAGVVGQLNLVGGVVTDTLPAGASLVGTSPCVTQSGNVLTWNVGYMDALLNLNSVDCEFSVSYPAGTTSVTNIANLMGSLGSEERPCDNFASNAKVCVKIDTPSVGGVFNKTVSTTGQPGCGGKYVVSVRNTGTDPATVVFRDTLPSQLSVVSATSSPAGALNITVVGNIVTATSNTPINPNQTVAVVINFTINSTTPLGISITNCAHGALTTNVGTVNGRPCATFGTNVPGARACIWKQVCNKKTSYNIGDTIRYRLRVQNTGGIALNGGVITDILNPNLQFLGNISSHSSINWNVVCGTVNPWGTVGVTTAGNTVTFTLPSIPPTCQDAFYNNCGAYGSPLVPFYFVEFDVRVVDTASLGNTPNVFTFRADSLATITSNADLVTIAGSLGLGAIKEVSNNGGSSWANSVVSTPGATVQYRLRSNIDVGSVGLRHVSFVDLLPRNNNNTTDHFLLSPCANRGSDFDLTVVVPISTSPFATGFNNAGAYARVNDFNPTPFAGPLFLGCGTNNGWASTINPGDRNIGYYFQYSGIGSGSPASAIFSAKLSTSAAPNTKACNTFSMIGFVKHLFNTSSSTPTTSFVSCLPTESPVACVEVHEAVQACIKKLDYKIECKDKTPLGYQQYAIEISGDNTNASGNTIKLSSPDGSFSPNTFSIPFGGFSVNSIFTDLPPAIVGGTMVVYISLYKDNSFLCMDSLKLKVPECPKEEDCCTGFIHEFYDQFVKYDEEKDQVYLGGCINAGPEKIQNFSYTIVSAEREIYCRDGERPVPERIYGDIIYSGLNMSMYPGFSQWLDYITREVKWGKYKECYNLMEEKLCYRSILAFPPPPQPCEACYDVLKFSVRYSFTDCRCLTCDTVIQYTLTRRCKPRRSEFVKGDTPTGVPSFLVDRKAIIAPKNGGSMRTPNK